MSTKFLTYYLTNSCLHSCSSQQPYMKCTGTFFFIKKKERKEILQPNRLGPIEVGPMSCAHYYSNTSFYLFLFIIIIHEHHAIIDPCINVSLCSSSSLSRLYHKHNMVSQYIDMFYCN